MLCPGVAMSTSVASQSVLLERVVDLIHSNLSPEESAPVAELALAIYGQVSLADLQKQSDSDLYGAILSLWRLACEAQGEQAHIRILNPCLDRDGWHSNHTIVEIALKDIPFLVDSVRMALNRLGIATHLLLHAPLQIQRAAKGKIKQIRFHSEQAKQVRETLFHIEIDRQASEQEQQLLAQELKMTLSEVQACVNDWQPMVQQLGKAIAEIDKSEYPQATQSKSEVMDFLRWVVAHNFTLLGYQQTQIKAIAGDYEIRVDPSSELGILNINPTQEIMKLSEIIPSGQQAAMSSEILVLTKSNQKSRVHRPAFTDYIGIKRFNRKGQVIGEHRFIGLYSSTLYNNSALHVPMLKSKLERIMAMSGLVFASHAYKALLNLIETYPRDELIQASEKELLDVGLGVLQMQERDMTRLFVRRELFGRFYSCMVYVTKERYNTQLRKQTQAILQDYFGSDHPVEFTTYFAESELARTHYIIHVDQEFEDLDVNQIEQNLIEAARSWDDRFGDALTKKFGENEGRQLAARYQGAFVPSYKERVLPNSALVDVDKIEQIIADHELGMLFYQPQENSGSQEVCLKLFHRHEPIPLSDVLPVLENLGLKVIGERPYEVKDAKGQITWILEFTMLYLTEFQLDLSHAQERFQQALAGIWQGDFENDGFNRLVLGSGLSARQVSILRAYAKYMRQLGVSFSQHYIESALNNYPEISAKLVELFEERFKPGCQDENSKVRQQTITEYIESSLEQVSNLDDDRIIRRYQAMILATIRTNAYQGDANDHDKPYISFKLVPDQIPEVPLPVPAFEIFVYSPRFEGVHLRGGKVARGGLRWSDRREDFRTEILGLVKAQQVKNTVIVPVGAKGGFVCKKMPKNASRDEFLKEGQACYQLFIRALLDVTDNLIKGDLVPPKHVIRYDEMDPYLVVAADKGTATFSDIANEIAQEYGFWLGDAFASGGSQGYDHKKMGITASGAWESVKRHFREIGLDCQSQPFTAIGIGDMAGDVFGNGMLLSKQTRLIAAFNHLHIFIDPEPDIKRAYAERQRLFKLPRSSWSDYQTELLAEGGGIYSRSAKKIKISKQAQQALALSRSSYTPNELIQAILQSPVDLIWNGGIGTYVKSASESHVDVGDRANDSVRIDGSQLKAKVFGEGGNLGATQLGRIEFARQGGYINTDFIDNVGGVDCSDIEVNIKILLNLIEQEGELTRKQRNHLLVTMTEDVSSLVLDDCYQQTQSISVTQLSGSESLKEQVRFIQALEKQGVLNRALEFLPTDEEISQRQVQDEGLSRPELSVLLSYDKMTLKEALISDAITMDSYQAETMLGAFPLTLQNQYGKQMAQHPLRQEIIATQIANQVVNDMGLNFVNRMRDETGAEVHDIVSSYTMAREVFFATRFRERIQALDNQISAVLQLQCLDEMRRILRHATRWFLRHRNRAMSIKDTVMFFQPGYQAVMTQLPQSLAPEDVERIRLRSETYEEQGVPADLANTLAQQTLLFSALDITQVAESQSRPIELISDIYFQLGAKLQLHWFLELVIQQPVANHWQALARNSFREELDWQQRALTLAVDRYCQEGCSATAMVDRWFEEHQTPIERWMQMLNEFKTASGHEYAKFSVALRELMLLSHTSDQL